MLDATTRPITRPAARPLILITACLAALTINLDTTIVNVALPELATELDAGTRELLWIVDGYNLAFAALVLAMGSLSDRFGRRPALILGLAGFGLASGAAALVDSAGALIALRFVMGFFAALIFPTTLSIIANAFPERRERAMALGAWGAATGVGVALGPVTGGWLLEHFTWHAVFWALLPVAAITMVMAIVFVPESRDRSVPRLDFAGLGVSVAALGLLTHTIIEGPERGWSSTQTLLGFVGAALLVAVFIAVERRVEHPMLDVRLFGDPRFSAASGAVTIAFFSLFGFIFLITQFFQFVRDYTPLEAGVRTIPVAVSIAVASILGGVLAPRLGTKLVVATGLALLGSAFGWIAASEVDIAYATTIVPQMVLMGLGLGLVSTPATESILQVLPPARAGIGSAVNDATRELGGTLGVAVIGSVFSSVYASRLADVLTGQMPEPQLEAAQESVGVAVVIGREMPDLRPLLDAAFMDGLSAGCTVISVLCFVGAVGAAIALPGRNWRSPEAAKVAEAPTPSASPSLEAG